MNLNTFARHGVFDVDGHGRARSPRRLRDPEAIAQARVFPYQLMAAYTMTGDGRCRRVVRDALQDAMELAIANVPRVDGKVVCLPGRVGLDALAGDRVTARARRRRCGASTWRRWSRRRCCGRTRARVLPFEIDVVECA